MRWSYDADCRALYMQLRTGEVEKQREMEDGTIVDVDVAGDVVGVEIIAPLISTVDIGRLTRTFGLTDDERDSIVLILLSDVVRLGWGGRARSEELTTTDSEPVVELPQFADAG